MELNTKKIEQEMARLGLNKNRLAKKMGITRQAVNYYFKEKPISMAERFGKFFKINPRDFIK